MTPPKREHEHNIVDGNGLAKAFKCSPSLIRKVWKDYPHFFLGEGRDLRGARFDLDDVLYYLKGERNYGSLEIQNKRMVGSKISVSRKALQEGGFQVADGGHPLGSIQKRSALGSSDGDPFNILPRSID